MLPHVSVIIPTFNRAAFLEAAIDSVLTQSYPHFELIVVDDGSNDETPEIVSAYGLKLRYIQKEKNEGPAAARNVGIAAAQHELLAFLDSDDWFHKDKLKLQVAQMGKYPEILISHTQETWFRKGKHLNQKKIHQKNSGDIFRQSLRLCAVGMSTIMVRRGFFELVGLFDEDLPCCEDYDLWLRASISHPFLLVDEPLTLKNGGREDQVSSQYRIGMDRFRVQAILNVLSDPALSKEQYNLAAAELVRKCTIYGEGCIKHDRHEEGQDYLEIAARYREE